MRSAFISAALSGVLTFAPPALAQTPPAKADLPPVGVTQSEEAPAQAAAPASPAKGKAPAKALAKKKTPQVPAKVLFGSARTPAPLQARAIGSYARGCLSGAVALPVDGPEWQAMRLSRNRNWGHPELVKLVQRLASDVKRHDGWPGLLVGDLAQPRGGPMLTGHASHQIGLDADIWLTPMPDRRLTEKEREDIAATSMLSSDIVTVDPKIWTPAHARILKRAASYPEVERVLVHPAIKRALCDGAGTDKAWLHKVRPYWGHHYHFHVRIACPKGSTNCEPQKAAPADDGCGKELQDWIKLVAPRPKPPVPPDRPVRPPQPEKPKPQITLDQLPPECRTVLQAGRPGLALDVGDATAPVPSATPPQPAAVAPAPK